MNHGSLLGQLTLDLAFLFALRQFYYNSVGTCDTLNMVDPFSFQCTTEHESHFSPCSRLRKFHVPHSTPLQLQWNLQPEFGLFLQRYVPDFAEGLMKTLR